VSEVAGRVADDWGICVVTSGEGIVVGLLGRQTLRSAERVRAEDAMSLGPSTIRPSARKDAVARRMRDLELHHLVVTHSDGVFVGVVRREDLE
jgi:CBS domain-containing protein